MVDGGKGGGEQILHVFEKRLTDNIRKLDFDKILDPANVRRIVEEADGYQPHLIAPEMGYRRLLQVSLIVAMSADSNTRRHGGSLCAFLATSAPACTHVLAPVVCSLAHTCCVGELVARADTAMHALALDPIGLARG